MLEAPGDGFVPNHRDEGKELWGQGAACPEALSGSTAQRHPCLHTEIRAHRSSQGRAVCSLTDAPGYIPPRGGGGAPSHRVPPKEREWCGLNNISELSRELWEPSGALGAAERHQPGCPSYSYTHRGQIRNKFSIKWKSSISHAPINYCSTGSRNGKAVSKPRARKSSKMFTEEVFK